MKNNFKKILNILACPKCKGDLKLKDNWFVCYQCRLKYPIKNEIPILLIEEAKELKSDER